MRPDKFFYVINVDNRFFTRPRRLLRPVVLESSTSPLATCPARVSPPILRRAERFQSCASSSAVQTSVLPFISPCLYQPVSLTRLPRKSILKSGEGLLPLPQLMPIPLCSTTTQVSASSTKSISPMSRWTNPTTD